MYCSNCGAQLAGGANFCPSCGKQISATETTIAAASDAGPVPDGMTSQEQKKKIALWVLGLFSASIIWALLVNTAMVGPSIGKIFPDQIVVALGIVIFPFSITGAIAGLVYYFKRKPSTAMWTWTVLLLVALLMLSIGATRMTRGTALKKPLDFFGFSNPSTTAKKLGKSISEDKSPLTDEDLLAHGFWPVEEAGMIAYDLGDYATALKIWRRLAEQGNVSALYRQGAQDLLGNMYNEGKGVPQDYVEAYKWYSLVVIREYGLELKYREKVRGKRDIVARKMTPDQIAEAQRLAREWKPKK